MRRGHSIFLRLDEVQWRYLCELAAKRRVSVQEVLRRLIEELLTMEEGK